MADETISKPAAATHRLPPNSRNGAGLLIRALHRMADSRTLTLFILIALLSGFMTVFYPLNFPTSRNIAAVLLNASPAAIMVTGMMLLMIGGAFDLSIGSTLALSGVAAGVTVGWWGWPAEVGLLVGVATGAIAGLTNGLIVTRLGINALIATLATMSIFRGLTFFFAKSGVTPISSEFKAYGQSVTFGLQAPFWVMLAVVLVSAWAVARTRFFRQYFYIGGNPGAARLSGINVQRLTLIGFVIMGTLAGLAGVLGAARLNSAVVSAGVGAELSVITAAVLGGASLKGGEGSIIGGVLGVLFIALVQNAMIINGLGIFWQSIVIGLVLLLAVSLDRFRQ